MLKKRLKYLTQCVKIPKMFVLTAEKSREWTKKYNELGVIDGIFTTEDSKRELPPLSKWNAEV